MVGKAQVHNYYTHNYSPAFYKDGCEGFWGLNFSDSALTLDTFWAPKFRNLQGLEQIYCDATGKPKLCIIKTESFGDFVRDHVFLLPDSHLYSPPDTQRAWIDLVPRDDSTFWILENGIIKRYVNAQNGEINEVTKQETSFGPSSFENQVPAYIPFGDRLLLLDFSRDDERNLIYQSLQIDRNGVLQSTSGLVPILTNLEKNRNLGISPLAWNASKHQVSWITYQEHVRDDYSLGTSLTALWTADVDTTTGTLSGFQLLRKDSIQYKPGPFNQPDEVIVANYQVTEIEYSPNGKYLYMLEKYPFPGRGFSKGRLVQHNLDNGHDVIIADATPFVLDSLNQSNNELYLAPNGKIYVFLAYGDLDSAPDHEISYPDKSGKDCGFQKKAQNRHFKTRSSVTRPYYEKRANIGQVNPCTDQHRFVNNGHKSFKKLRWHFFDIDSNLLHSLAGDSVLCPKLPVGPHLVLLRGEDPKGFVNWHWDSFYYSPPVTASIQLLDSVACEFNQIRFADSSLNLGPSDALSWKWEFSLNNQLLQTATQQHPQVVFEKEGNYTIKLRFSNGICADSTTLTNALSIKDGPKPGFSVSDTLVCTPATISVVDSSSGAITNGSFRWSDGFTADKDHNRKLQEPKTYQVVQTLVGPNGCQSADSHTLRIRPGIRQLGRPYILKTTVAGHRQIQIDWDTLGQAHSYTLWRIQDSVDEVEIPIANPAHNTYTDVGAETAIRSYQYQLTPVDSCGNEGWRSNLGTSLLLRATNQQNKVAILRWNAYESWEKGVSEYVVESSENGADWLPIDASKQLTFPDYRLPNLDADTLWYRIKATEQDGRTQQSYSNVVKVLASNTLFIPNAFSPNADGVNDVFKIGSFGLSEITCTVFARNGQIVSYSTDPAMLWDGTLMGNTVPVGAYTYILRAINSKGEPIEVNGVVMVVR